MDKETDTRILRCSTLPFIEVKTGAGETYAVRRHSHDTLSFGFVEKGSSKIICQPLEFDLSVNQAILIPPETIHLCQPKDPEKFIFRMLYLDPAWVKATFGCKKNVFYPETITLSREDLRLKNLFFKGFEANQIQDRMLEETNAIFYNPDDFLFCIF